MVNNITLGLHFEYHTWHTPSIEPGAQGVIIVLSLLSTVSVYLARFFYYNALLASLWTNRYHGLQKPTPPLPNNSNPENQNVKVPGTKATSALLRPHPAFPLPTMPTHTPTRDESAPKRRIRRFLIPVPYHSRSDHIFPSRSIPRVPLLNICFTVVYNTVRVLNI